MLNVDLDRQTDYSVQITVVFTVSVHDPSTMSLLESRELTLPEGKRAIWD
jgi:hypothetical protein